METAYQCYKNHPNFDKIKFIMVPDMRESMNISSDIPFNINDIIEEFRHLIPQLDFSLFDNYDDNVHWFLENMDDKIKHKIKPRIEPNDNDCIGTNAYQLIMNEVSEVYPENLESRWNIFDRATRVKQFVKNYLANTHLEEGEKVVMVAHYVFIKIYTAKYTQEHSRDEPLPEPEQNIQMRNCELICDPTNYSNVESM